MTDWMTRFIHSSNVEVDNEKVKARFKKYQKAEREIQQESECPLCDTPLDYYPADPRLGCAPVPGAVVGSFRCECGEFRVPATAEYVIGPFGGEK